MTIEMIEPITPEQPVTHQGVFMDQYKAPNLVGIIMQALESHITALVDKRFNERMADTQPDMPSMDELKDHITEMIDEKFQEHTDEYDHDEYDQCVRDVDNAGLDDFDEKIKDTLRGLSITLDV